MSKKILVVEDDKWIGLYFTQRIIASGLECEVATALDLASRAIVAGGFDAVIMDENVVSRVATVYQLDAKSVFDFSSKLTIEGTTKPYAYEIGEHVMMVGEDK